MSETVIRVEHLGKKYIIGHQAKERYLTLRDTIANRTKALLNPFRQKQTESNQEEFWALKDITFEIKQGERVGVIGRNGAGKSTLLKVLSKITEPTTGQIRIKGRVASLLEVGTGFHPELTGRENIYLNGAILGMSRAEIRRKFDEIVDFAEVEKFLDTPVKRYSSGMYVRLAFAVAAHLEPEILIVDEVLAVGDAAFQKKCLGKMEDVGREGRTVIFVSHSMPMIASLCETCLLMKQGEVIQQGKTSAVITYYQSDGQHSPGAVDYSSSSKPPGDDLAVLRKGWIEDCRGKQSLEVQINEPLVVIMEYEVNQKTPGSPLPNFHFYDSKDNCAFITSPRVDTTAPSEPGVYRAVCHVPANFLNDGIYSVGLALTFMHSGVHVSFYDQSALIFNVTDPIEGVITREAGYVGPVPGILRPLLDWDMEKIA